MFKVSRHIREHGRKVQGCRSRMGASSPLITQADCATTLLCRIEIEGSEGGGPEGGSEGGGTLAFLPAQVVYALCVLVFDV